MGIFVLCFFAVFFSFVQFTKYSYALLLQCCCCYCCCPKRYEANLCVSEYYERLYNTSMQDYAIQCVWILLNLSSLYQKSIGSFFLAFSDFFFSACADREKNHALNLMHTKTCKRKRVCDFISIFFCFCVTVS